MDAEVDGASVMVVEKDVVGPSAMVVESDCVAAMRGATRKRSRLDGQHMIVHAVFPVTYLARGMMRIRTPSIIILQVWCSLKSVTTTLCLLFSWLHILHSTVVIILGNLASIPSYSCLVYMIL